MEERAKLDPRELIQRNLSLYRIGALVTAAALNAFYDLRFAHLDRLRAYRKSPFILLPGHQTQVDTPIESHMIDWYLHRPAYHVMKAELPDELRLLGGVKVNRPKGKLTAENKRKEIRIFLDQREQVYDCLAHLYNEGEAIVVHPEGTRNYHREGVVDRGILGNLVRLKTRNAPVFIPLDIKYRDVRQFGSPIWVTVGRPIETRDVAELLDRLHSEIDFLRK